MRKAIFFLLVTAPACSRSSGNTSGAPSRPADSVSSSVASPRSAEPTQEGAASASALTTTGIAKKWDFEGDAPNAAPSGFSFGRTGRGREGRWIVRADVGTKVLAQVDADDTSFRFPVAVANEPSLRDVRVSVRCKMVSGKVDQACGLIARYAAPDNYFVTRANALENNIRLYTVRNGSRDEIASFSETVTPNTWHDYRFELRGDHLQVFWDGKRVIEHRDSTFAAAGRAGVWTKADSVTYFDDFAVEPL